MFCQAWRRVLLHVSKTPPMRKSLSQSWIPVKESKAVARVAMEGLSAIVLVMVVKSSGRLLKFMIRASTRRGMRGREKRPSRLARCDLTFYTNRFRWSKYWSGIFESLGRHMSRARVHSNSIPTLWLCSRANTFAYIYPRKAEHLSSNTVIEVGSGCFPKRRD